MYKYRRSTLLLAVLVAAAMACGSAPNRRISRITPLIGRPVTLHSTVSQTTDVTCDVAEATKPLVRGSHVETISTAYRSLLRVFIRPLDSTMLLNAAWLGATDEVKKEAGSDAGVPAPQLTDTTADSDWQAFSDSYAALVQATDGRVDQLQLAFAAISQMANSVNEGHTYFLEPEAYAQLGKEASISGIGVVLKGKESPFVIAEVVDGAPADRAGIRPGDTFVAVNGCDVSSLKSVQLATRVRGPAGTSVHLTMNRQSTGRYDVDIIRAQITFPAVQVRMLPSNIGVMRLHSFPSASEVLAGGRTLADSLDATLASFRDAKARGWILDLRGNPGGSVDAVRAFAGRILPPGTVFSATNRTGARIEERTTGTRITEPPLLAVLVDDGSASGSEILSAAIQDDSIAPIIGGTTAGVANAAEVRGIGDGAGLSITIWQTYTPHGRPLNGSGVTPDIVVQQTADDLAAGIDPPLDRASQLAR